MLQKEQGDESVCWEEQCVTATSAKNRSTDDVILSLATETPSFEKQLLSVVDKMQRIVSYIFIISFHWGGPDVL